MKIIELQSDWLTQKKNKTAELAIPKKPLNCHQTLSLTEDGVWRRDKHKTHQLTSSSADSTDSHEYRPDRENDSVGVTSFHLLLDG